MATASMSKRRQESGDETKVRERILEAALVDVTGIEPVTPCLQTRRGKTVTALSGVAYAEISEISALLIVPKLSRTSQLQAHLFVYNLFAAGRGGREAEGQAVTRSEFVLACRNQRRPPSPATFFLSLSLSSIILCVSPEKPRKHSQCVPIRAQDSSRSIPCAFCRGQK
jgi:hypothetical protein